MSTGRVRGRALAMVGLLLVALAVAGTAGAVAPKATTGTVRAVVRHLPGPTSLAGVEVFLWGAGTPHYACTNASGVAVFTGLTPGTNYIAATGPSVRSPGCANAEFLDAAGKKMWTVFWNRHRGVRYFDSFTVVAGESTTLLFVTSTPLNQRKICLGMRVTILGTTGDDVGPTRIIGTAGNDVINALGGNDLVFGRGGDDLICGGPGSDTLYGEDGSDWIAGESGPDLLVGGAGSDTLVGGNGTDTCKTGETLLGCEK